MKHLEDAECKALWEWSRLVPVARDYLYHIPNGGKRNPKEAARMNGMGVRAGVSDYHLPVARGDFIGLWIEMKAGTNVMTAEQKRWQEDMNEQGHAACVCWGWISAKDVIEWYLSLPAPENVGGRTQTSYCRQY